MSEGKIIEKKVMLVEEKIDGGEDDEIRKETVHNLGLAPNHISERTIVKPHEKEASVFKLVKRCNFTSFNIIDFSIISIKIQIKRRQL